MQDNIKLILEDLNKNPGVFGSIIMTKEGIIIASDLTEEINADLIAAITSSICLTVKNSLEEIQTICTRYTITTEKVKLIIINLDKSFLIVIGALTIDIAELNLSIFQATTNIKKTERIDI